MLSFLYHLIHHTHMHVHEISLYAALKPFTYMHLFCQGIILGGIVNWLDLPCIYTMVHCCQSVYSHHSSETSCRMMECDYRQISGLMTHFISCLDIVCD
jgi:hypothetical protein